MNRITITLTPEVMAAKAGLSPEAFSRLSFVRLLDTTATVRVPSTAEKSWSSGGLCAATKPAFLASREFATTVAAASGATLSEAIAAK